MKEAIWQALAEENVVTKPDALSVSHFIVSRTLMELQSMYPHWQGLSLSQKEDARKQIAKLIHNRFNDKPAFIAATVSRMRRQWGLHPRIEAAI